MLRNSVALNNVSNKSFFGRNLKIRILLPFNANKVNYK